MSGDILSGSKTGHVMMEAASSSVVDKNDNKIIEELWSITECVICKLDINNKVEIHESMLLTCLHAICSSCYKSWDASVDKICPVCILPSKKNETRLNKVLSETVSDFEIPKTEGIVCNIHDSPVTHWCVNCAEFICDECVRSHGQLKSTRDHVISTKDEYVKGITLENTKPVFPCSKHPQNQLTIVCHTCRGMTCRDCQLEIHRDHKYDFLTDKIDEAKTEIYKFYKKIEYHSIMLTSALEKISVREDKIEELKQKTIVEIKETTDKVVTLIRKRCHDLMLTAVTKANDKITECKQSSEDLKKDLHVIKHCLHFVKTVINQSSDPTIYYTKDLMLKHMERVRSNNKVPNAVDVINMKFVPENMDSMRQCIKNFGKVDLSQDYNLSSVDPEYHRTVFSVLMTNYSDQLGIAPSPQPPPQQIPGAVQVKEEQHLQQLLQQQPQIPQQEPEILEQDLLLQQQHQQDFMKIRQLQQQQQQQHQLEMHKQQRMLQVRQHQQQQIQQQKLLQQQQQQQEVVALQQQQQQAWLKQNSWQQLSYRRDPQGHYVAQQAPISPQAQEIAPVQVSSGLGRNNLLLLTGTNQRMHAQQQQQQQPMNPHLQRIAQQTRVQASIPPFQMLQQSQQQRISPQQQQQMVHSGLSQQQQLVLQQQQQQQQRAAQQQRVSPHQQHRVSPQQQQQRLLSPTNKSLPSGISLQSLTSMQPPRAPPQPHQGHQQPSVVFYTHGGDVVPSHPPQQQQTIHHQPRHPPPPYAFQAWKIHGAKEGQTWHIPETVAVAPREPRLPSPADMPDGIKKVKISPQQAEAAELRNQLEAAAAEAQRVQEAAALMALTPSPNVSISACASAPKPASASANPGSDLVRIKPTPKQFICKQEPETDLPEPSLQVPDKRLPSCPAMEVPPLPILTNQEELADVLTSLNELNRSLDRVEIASDKQHEEADPNEDWCAVCMDGGDLICCEHCPKVFHNACHIPQIVSSEGSPWRCLLCERIEPANSNDDGQLTPKIHKILCRVLLEMYCQYDSSYHFRSPVPAQMANYYDTISQPICLNEIRNKLVKNMYNNIIEFVSDVKRMFNNCYAYFEATHPTAVHGKSLEEFFNSLLNKFMPSDPVNIKTEMFES